MSLIRRWLRRTDRAMDTMAATPAKVRDGGWWDRNRQLVEVGGVWLEALGVLTAAIVAINQYQSNSRAERVNMTLKYLDRYQTDRVFNARKTLENSWNAKSREVFEIMKAPDGEAQLARFLDVAIAEMGLDPPIATILDFYDELQACTTANLCDRGTAVRFFGKYASDLHGLLAPHIRHQRAEMHDDQIGAGVDYFSRQYLKYKQVQDKAGPTGALD